MQRSDEVIKKAAESIGVKALACHMRLSSALVYKWCQACDPEDPDSSGARNPLDRVAEIYRATHDSDVVNWVCHQADGFFVPNPKQSTADMNTSLLVGTQHLVKEFSDMLEEVSRSIANDGMIEPNEAARIRRHWETLKRVSEAFVIDCEQGRFSEAE